MVISYRNMTDAQIEEYTKKSIEEAKQKRKEFQNKFKKYNKKDNSAAFNTVTYNCVLEHINGSF